MKWWVVEAVDRRSTVSAIMSGIGRRREKEGPLEVTVTNDESGGGGGR